MCIIIIAYNLCDFLFHAFVVRNHYLAVSRLHERWHIDQTVCWTCTMYSTKTDSVQAKNSIIHNNLFLRRMSYHQRVHTPRQKWWDDFKSKTKRKSGGRERKNRCETERKKKLLLHILNMPNRTLYRFIKNTNNTRKILDHQRNMRA